MVDEVMRLTGNALEYPDTCSSTAPVAPTLPWPDDSLISQTGNSMRSVSCQEREVMPIRSETVLFETYESCACCRGVMVTRNPQAVMWDLRDEWVGYVCDDCLRCSSDDVRAFLERTAAWHRQQASRLEALLTRPIDEICGQAWVEAVAALPEQEVDPDYEAFMADRG